MSSQISRNPLNHYIKCKLPFRFQGHLFSIETRDHKESQQFYKDKSHGEGKKPLTNRTINSQVKTFSFKLEIDQNLCVINTQRPEGY